MLWLQPGGVGLLAKDDYLVRLEMGWLQLQPGGLGLPAEEIYLVGLEMAFQPNNTPPNYSVE